jgi:hypothetical protein
MRFYLKSKKIVERYFSEGWSLVKRGTLEDPEFYLCSPEGNPYPLYNGHTHKKLPKGVKPADLTKEDYTQFEAENLSDEKKDASKLVKILRKFPEKSIKKLVKED